jgi:ankyrin repeat protein
LGLAARIGDQKMVKLLLTKKADPNLADDRGYTPLYEAILKDNRDMVKFLIENKADPNALIKSFYGNFTPLMNANDPAVVRLLIEKGACVNEQNEQGATALMLLVGERTGIVGGGMSRLRGFPKDEDKLAIIKILLESGAQINLKDHKGKTALDYATSKLKKDQRRAEKARKNRNVKKAEQFEKELPLDNKIIELLKEAGAKEGRELRDKGEL